MEDKELTQEQVKMLWEWCGFKQLEAGRGGYHFRSTKKIWNWLPPGETERHKSIPFLPPVDLNNLFKYAVPKLERVKLYHVAHYLDYRAEVQLADDAGDIISGANRLNPDPALALFWAIWQIIKEIK